MISIEPSTPSKISIPSGMQSEYTALVFSGADVGHIETALLITHFTAYDFEGQDETHTPFLKIALSSTLPLVSFLALRSVK